MSTDAALLRFQIQGSAATPYRLTAEGVGAAFRMFCSCPAGRKARLMCKHVAALLMGEVGALVDPSDCVLKLAQWAHGSELLARAFQHQPATKPPERALDAPLQEGFAAAFASLVVQAKAAGWAVTAGPERISLHGLSKLGRLRKHPTITLGVADTPVRPFYVAAPEGMSRSFGSAERAGAHLAEIIGRFRP